MFLLWVNLRYSNLMWPQYSPWRIQCMHFPLLEKVDFKPLSCGFVGEFASARQFCTKQVRMKWVNRKKKTQPIYSFSKLTSSVILRLSAPVWPTAMWNPAEEMPKGLRCITDLSFATSLDGNKQYYDNVNVQKEEFDHPVIRLARVEETPPKHLLVIVCTGSTCVYPTCGCVQSKTIQ